MKKLLISLLVFFGTLGIFSTIGLYYEHQFPWGAKSAIKPQQKQLIFPTLYVTGSSGKPEGDVDQMIQSIVDTKKTNAKQGLQIIVDTAKGNSLKISGNISPQNSHPTISIGMVKGTNSSKKYEVALKSVMDYLEVHYEILSINMLGFSAGGAGIYRYLINYSKDSHYPKVMKFLSLDGQYNASTPMNQEERLADVLKKGPQNQTKYYKYWIENTQKISPEIEVLLLDGNYDAKNNSDGTVPYADAFSVYPLLQKNKNKVAYQIYDSPNHSHGQVAKNLEAIKIVEKFLYGAQQ